MICQSCTELRSGEQCPECGASLLPVTAPHLDALIEARLRRRIDGWRAENVLDEVTAARLLASLSAPVEVVPHPVPEPEPLRAEDVERRADAIAASIERLQEWRPGWGASLARALEESARAEREAEAAQRAAEAERRRRRGASGHEEDDEDLELAAESGRALFGGMDVGGLGALAALDAPEGNSRWRTEIQPLLNEYVWWFLGALLVLGGSIMGVREAWRALGGVPRQLIVSGALLAYHGAFIGLGTFLGRRSASAGRVLAGIGLALLPVLFVALSALTGLAPGLGLVASLLASGICFATFRPAGRLLHGASPVSLALALFPSLWGGLALPLLEGDPWLRGACMFAGVVALALALWRPRDARGEQVPLSVPGFALYGALALAVFSVASGASGFDELAPGEPMFAGLVLWSVALAAVVAGAASRPAVRERYPRAAPAVEVLAHAVGASGALAAAVAMLSLEPGENLWVQLVSALTPAVAAGVFFLLEPRRRALVHPGVVGLTLSGVLLGRFLMPSEPAWWVTGAAVVPSGLMLVARACRQGSLRPRLLTWGVVLGLASLPVASVVGSLWSLGPERAMAATGALVAVSAHLAGGHRWRGLHYLGGVAAVYGGLAAADASRWCSGPWLSLAVFAVAGVLYGLAGLGHGAWMRRAKESEKLQPLDDVSLAVATLGVIWAIGAAPVLPEGITLAEGMARAVLVCVPTLCTSALLLLRVWRDRSRLVSFVAASGLALTVAQFAVFGAGAGGARAAFAPASVALAFAVLALLRGKGPSTGEATAGQGARWLLGAGRLPFGARGWPLYTDGFVVSALVLGTLATTALVGWLSAPVEAERSWVVLSGGLLVGVAVLAFFSRGFVALRLRGSVLMLGLAGGLIALTAVLNRVGRPLPPEVVALRLPLIGVALWGFALLARRFGPWLAGRLEKDPRHGRLYHFVPHAGVAALSLLLAVDAVLVGLPDISRALTVVPPLMPLGAAVLALLLARSFRSRRLTRAAWVLGLPGAALWAAQHSLLGPALVAMDPPGGRWVRAEALEASLSLGWLQPEAWLPAGETVFLLWQRAFAGVAVAGFVYAVAALVLSFGGERLARLRRFLNPEAEDRFHERFVWELRDGTVYVALLVGCAAFFQPGLPAAQWVFASGLVLLVGGAASWGRVVLGLSPLLIIHAVAHRSALVGSWAGPSLALVGVAVGVLVPEIARRRGRDEGVARVRAHFVAHAYAAMALGYALAAGSPTDPAFAVPRLFLGALSGMAGLWMRAYALPAALLGIAALWLVGAFQWRGAVSRFNAAWGTVLVGGAGVTGAAVWLVSVKGGVEGPWPYANLMAAHGVSLALAAAVSVAVAHGASRWIRTHREHVARGMVFGRDVWLLGTGGLLALSAVLLGPEGEALLPQALAALGLAVAVALHCAWREHTGRHVYFVQMAVVGVYALVRALYAPGLRSEHDALFALTLGFVLVGVTVLARRAGVPPVEAATRRFAALLPLGIALVLPREASGQAAMLAGGSGLLYAALGAVEQSRLFGSFAAAACNVALLVASLAYGLEGIEIYLAPLGLLLLMLGQLFAGSLPRAARMATRILGGVLLYLPAAGKLALQVGGAADGTYGVVFGGVCVLGVVAGMLLQIRAYLALGTLFLTLDVVANLVHAGLRDHRVGFVVMTAAGLTIVGGRVLATLKRRELEALVQRVRVELRGWD
ncbi:hypothetical protein P2318_17950 [Myxococcaceae bacterium GXIMD 01537]